MRKILFAALALLAPSIAVADVVVEHKTKNITVTPTISTSAYSVGHTIGGILTFTGAARSRANGGTVYNVIIFDGEAAFSDLELVLFRESPAGTTTDRATFDPDNDDLADAVCQVFITGADDCKAYNDNGMCSKAAQCAFELDADGNDLYGILVSRGTPTYAVSSDISVTLQILQD